MLCDLNYVGARIEINLLEFQK
uniref:Uncharacterized protein n=1 Tax=Arundo donax TaxID=35708 RepID=A0A0A9B3D2_ARUDO